MFLLPPLVSQSRFVSRCRLVPQLRRGLAFSVRPGRPNWSLFGDAVALLFIYFYGNKPEVRGTAAKELKSERVIYTIVVLWQDTHAGTYHVPSPVRSPHARMLNPSVHIKSITIQNVDDRIS